MPVPPINGKRVCSTSELLTRQYGCTIQTCLKFLYDETCNYVSFVDLCAMVVSPADGQVFRNISL
jgi:hypothetical protein